jgi:hypothetical protein
MTNAEVGTMQSGGYKYGSVNKDDEEAAGNNNNNNSYFKESDLYYYKEDDLTKKEKLMKIIKSCIPILIAVLLIGGITWILVQNFGTLYPSPGQRQRIRPSTGIENSSSSSHHNAPLNDDDSIHAPILTPRTSKDTTATTATTSSTKDNGKSSCSAYSKCFDLGLTGECCPTLAGDKLECCN